MTGFATQATLVPSTLPPDRHGIVWRTAGPYEVNGLLATAHYLGPVRTGRLIHAGFRDGVPVAVQVWRLPAARHLPNDGTWLELARWCLTEAAGPNAGSRQHRQVVKLIRDTTPATTLVSYSDPSVGHTGSLYRACNWRWAPTWHRLRPPPSGNGSWDGVRAQSVKDRWVFELRRDAGRDAVLAVKDAALTTSVGGSGVLGLARRSVITEEATPVAEVRRPTGV
jgi:hypothetical protein